MDGIITRIKRELSRNEELNGERTVYLSVSAAHKLMSHFSYPITDNCEENFVKVLSKRMFGGTPIEMDYGLIDGIIVGVKIDE